MKPTVCCVMLVSGREQMVKRAIASFRAQTYERKHLLILYSGEIYPCPWIGEGARLHCVSPTHYRTIGALRNFANLAAVTWGADIIAHFDSDDWSHSRRLAEQVALLEASGKQCVGYRELLFWDTRDVHERPNQAWLYRNHDPRWAAGASFLYRRELWEQQPFDDAPHEDQRWWCAPLVSRNCVGISSVDPTKVEEYQCGGAIMRDAWGGIWPRMICQIHGANTEAYERATWKAPEWTRAADYDKHCAEVMKL